MTASCGVGHWAASAVESFSFCGNTQSGQVMEWNTIDNINKVRGASLFPRGQSVCNELWVVRLRGGRRGYRVRACGKILMQPEGDVSHRCPFKLVSWRARLQHRLITGTNVIFDTGVETKCSVIGTFLITQWPLKYLHVKLSVQSGLSKLSSTPTRNFFPLGHCHTQAVLNLHFTLGNQLLVSRAIEEKEPTYPENKPNLSTPPNWKHIIARDNALCV